MRLWYVSEDYVFSCEVFQKRRGCMPGSEESITLNRHGSVLTRVLFLSAFSSAISSSLSSSCSRQRFSSLVSTANSCKVTRGCYYWLNSAAAAWGHECRLDILITHTHTHCFTSHSSKNDYRKVKQVGRTGGSSNSVRKCVTADLHWSCKVFFSFKDALQIRHESASASPSDTKKCSEEKM